MTLRPGPWAVTWFGNAGPLVYPMRMIHPWDAITDSVAGIAAFSKQQGDAPIVLNFQDPYQWVRYGKLPAADFAAGWEAGFAKLAAAGVRIDLASLDAEPWEPQLADSLIAAYLRHYPDGQWCNFAASPITAAAQPHVLRYFGAANVPDDVQGTLGTVNAPAGYLSTGAQASVVTTRIARLAQTVNRFQAGASPQLIAWLSGRDDADAAVTRDEERDLCLLTCPLTGGRFLLFDESRTAVSTAGVDAAADVSAMLTQWATTLGSRKWVKACDADHWHGLDDYAITTWCRLDTGEFAAVTVWRDKPTKPLALSTPDGRTVVMPVPGDGSKRNMMVFAGKINQ